MAPYLALLELRAFPSFWPPIGHTYAREMLCRSSLLLTLKCVCHTLCEGNPARSQGWDGALSV